MLIPQKCSLTSMLCQKFQISELFRNRRIHIFIYVSKTVVKPFAHLCNQLSMVLQVPRSCDQHINDLNGQKTAVNLFPCFHNKICIIINVQTQQNIKSFSCNTVDDKWLHTRHRLRTYNRHHKTTPMQNVETLICMFDCLYFTSFDIFWLTHKARASMCKRRLK